MFANLLFGSIIDSYMPILCIGGIGHQNACAYLYHICILCTLHAYLTESGFVALSFNVLLYRSTKMIGSEDGNVEMSDAHNKLSEKQESEKGELEEGELDDEVDDLQPQANLPDREITPPGIEESDCLHLLYTFTFPKSLKMSLWHLPAY